jgi:hypothetical protein
VIDAGLSSEIVREAALVSLWAVVLIVQFAANFFAGFRFDDLPLD